MPKVLVIGSGIAGLAAARELSGHPSCQVTLLEAGGHFGGHAHTVDMTWQGLRHGVDTGFLVFNERTYPRLIQLLADLNVATASSDMSFSVQVPGKRGLEWSGHSLATVFAQRRNLLRPGFWQMLRDLLRFNRMCTRLALQSAQQLPALSIQEFLDQHRFSLRFRQDYLLPMIACIWSCPTEQMLRFPMATLIRFCHNHGLLQIAGRPRWFTVRGGSRHYVEKIVARLVDARLNTPVLRVQRSATHVVAHTPQGAEVFDAVIFACHSDQALALLGEQASSEERQVLGAIRYQTNRAVLHTDANMLPQLRSVWAAWNYERAASTEAGERVCLHYLINRLQPLPWLEPVIVSLNPIRPIKPELIHAEIDYAHPVFDQAAIDAQTRLGSLQGQQRTWYGGAWCGYGFHEDGLSAGLHAAQDLLAHREWSSLERSAA